MPESIFPEKRTRSQVVLPDDILRTTQLSPMKEAKNALKVQSLAEGTKSTTMGSLEETDDELLLSPGKQDCKSSRSKRSAPPEAQDEYEHSSASNGRELKRVRRDIPQKQGDKDTKFDETPHLSSGHTPNSPEPKILTAKRVPRKRSTTTSKKPLSTVSASPPPSTYTPVGSPSKPRAQSVPLFPSMHDVPRIDFRNPPKTPMRSRSPSRSPTKDKLRITSGGLPGSSSLPTIQDEMAMEVSDASATVDNIPRIGELLPPSSSEPIIRPLVPSTSNLSVVPATPMAESLNKLIPMSPLTPVPETPFPVRTAVHSESESRYEMTNDWSHGLFTNELAKPNDSTAIKESRLPRLMAPPSNLPSKSSKSAVPAYRPKKPTITSTKARTDSRPNVKNAFEEMKKAQQAICASSERPAPVDKSKAKMKERMKPRKPVAKKPLLPMYDDEEEEEEDSQQGEHTSTTVAFRSSPRPQSSITTEIAEASDARQAPMDHDMTMVDAQETHEEQDGESAADPDALGHAGDAQISQTLPSDVLQSLPAEGLDSEQNDFGKSSSPKTKSKLPLGKKRQPTSMVPVSRVTRSSSRQQEKGVEASPPVPFPRKKTTTTTRTSVKRTASGKVKKITSTVDETGMDTDPIEESDIGPGSPMKTSSPSKTPSKSPAAEDARAIKFGGGNLTSAKSLARSKTFVKPASTPSPSKIARATSLFIKPTITSVSHTVSDDLDRPIASGSGSSLSTLSNALEKLRMPPPSRPNTSMGFNRDVPNNEDDIFKPTSKDDTTLKPSGVGLPPVGLKRSVTLGGGAFRGPASSSNTSKKLVQRPISGFFARKGNGINAPGRSTGLKKLPQFGVGGPVRKTISKKSNLPVVVGSPVKGGATGDLDMTMKELGSDQDDENGVVGNDSGVFIAPTNTSTGSFLFEDVEGERSVKGKEKAVFNTLNASRRVSMVSHALSQSLSALPLSSGKIPMGPPPTPPSGRSSKRGTSSTVPETSSASGSSPSQTGPSNAPGTRSSARIASRVSQTKLTMEASTSSGPKGVAAVPSNPAPESLQILDGCIIFVDVKTDDGDEAGSLFVEMLEGMGAKVLARVGQTCTHIVYKNGLMSTLTRYRLLRDPKPLVVGIGWVVECVEQRKHLDETDFLVDVEGANVAGMNKRRRSILPKLFADAPAIDFGDAEGIDENEGDPSIDASASQEDLAPLERARRRKSMLVGPHP